MSFLKLHFIFGVKANVLLPPGGVNQTHLVVMSSRRGDVSLKA